MWILALFLAFVWGICWAVFLQRHSLGRFLAIKLTWITVAIGVGVDLVIALLVVEVHAWLQVVTIVMLSSVGIIARSLTNELGDMRRELDAKMLLLLTRIDRELTFIQRKARDAREGKYNDE
jgi:hypothetical protein